MSATPPPSSGDTPLSGPGPDVEPTSYPPYSASSGPSVSVPLGPGDPTVPGQPGDGTQPSPAGLGTPAPVPYLGYVDQYVASGIADPYPGTQSYVDPWLDQRANPYPPQAYADLYGGSQGYPDPNAAPYPTTKGYADPYAPGPGYAPAGLGYPPQWGYPAYGMTPMAPVAPLPTGMAVAAMVCGICGIVLSLCGGYTIALPIVGIVLGAITVQKANRGQAGGRNMAIAGIITGSIGVAATALVILLFIIAALASS